MKNINIDKENCIGCGACAVAAPEVFELGEDGKSMVKKGVDFNKYKVEIDSAVQGCPVSVISKEE